MRTSCRDGKGNHCKGAIATAEIAAQRVSEAAETVKAANDAYWLLVGKLTMMPAAQVENADLKAAAEVISKLPWVSASEEAIEATLLLLFPFGLALFTEIGAIVGFGLIFETRASGRRTVSAAVTPHPETVSPPPAGPRLQRFPETVTRKPSATVLQLPLKPRGLLSKSETLAFVQAEITQRGSIPSQGAIAAQCGRRKGTVSRWLRDWEKSGLISRQQEGRCKVVASA